jgi:hypothetical protein
MGVVDAVQGDGFSAAEIAAVQEQYPKLRCTEPYVVEGLLDLHASYEDNVLQDQFLICIAGSAEYPTLLPTLREIGDRTKEIAAKYRITDFRTLHRNGDGTACLCVKQMERRQVPFGSDLTVFVENLVIPYLYGLSYYDTNGRWPWAEYSHGALGLLEYYADSEVDDTRAGIEEVARLIRRENNWKDCYKQIRKPNADRLCLCGSKQRFKPCHPRVWQGTVRLHAEVERLGLRIFQ